MGWKLRDLNVHVARTLVEREPMWDGNHGSPFNNLLVTSR